MKFEYTGRHVEVTPAIREHVESHFGKIAHIFDDSTAAAHIIIEVEKNRHIGEILVHWREHTLTATDTNDNMYQALTRAIGKIEKQAIKLKKKLIDRSHSGSTSGGLQAAAMTDGSDILIDSRATENTNGGGAARRPRIIDTEPYQVKPMTAEEAAMRLESEADQFLVFRDADTERFSVLFKRKDGNYGLITG